MDSPPSPTWSVYFDDEDSDDTLQDEDEDLSPVLDISFQAVKPGACGIDASAVHAPKASIPTRVATTKPSLAILAPCDAYERSWNAETRRLASPRALARPTFSPVVAGKPLRSSLKGRSRPPSPENCVNLTTTPKSVRFPENDGLEMIKVFRRNARPNAVGEADGDLTDSEMDADALPINRTWSRRNFPTPASSPPSPRSTHGLFEIDPARTSAVPASVIPSLANIRLESLTMGERSDSPSVVGTLLVRNLMFEKHVAVRFTLDDWQTTNEVTTKHVVTLPSFPLAKSRRDGLVEDQSGEWDVFSFSVRLDDYAQRLHERTLWIAVRFTSVLGEWWDNNSGANYHVGFQRKSVISLQGAPTVASTRSVPSSAPICPRRRAASLVNSRHCNRLGSFLERSPLLGAAAPGHPTVGSPLSSGTKTRSRSNTLLPTAQRPKWTWIHSPAVQSPTTVLDTSRDAQETVASLFAAIPPPKGEPEESDSDSSTLDGSDTELHGEEELGHSRPSNATSLEHEASSPTSSSLPRSLNVSTTPRYLAESEGSPRYYSPASTIPAFLSSPTAGGREKRPELVDSDQFENLLDVFVKRWCFAQSPVPVAA